MTSIRDKDQPGHLFRFSHYPKLGIIANFDTVLSYFPIHLQDLSQKAPISLSKAILENFQYNFLL